MYIVLIILAVIYIIGIVVCCRHDTIKNVEFHRNAFLGMGYTTDSHRELTIKDVRRGLIWPLHALVFMACVFVYLINDTIKIVLLIFNFRYAETRMYEAINGWLARKI